jgi:hypothetical protein
MLANVASVLGFRTRKRIRLHKVVYPLILGAIPFNRALRSFLHVYVSEIRATTAVILSGPPCSLARAMRRPTQASGVDWMTVASISCAETMAYRPSVQRTRVSPCATCSVNRSISTSDLVPIQRVMTLRCGCINASSGVSLPALTCSATHEWSRDICLMLA